MFEVVKSYHVGVFIYAPILKGRFCNRTNNDTCSNIEPRSCNLSIVADNSPCPICKRLCILTICIVMNIFQTKRNTKVYPIVQISTYIEIIIANISCMRTVKIIGRSWFVVVRTCCRTSWNKGIPIEIVYLTPSICYRFTRCIYISNVLPISIFVNIKTAFTLITKVLLSDKTAYFENYRLVSSQH